METLNKIGYYINKIIAYAILAVGAIGIYVGIKSGERVGGGALGVLLVGLGTIADYFKWSKETANIILSCSLGLMLVSVSMALIRMDKIYFKILGWTLALFTVFYFGNLVFGWGF